MRQSVLIIAMTAFAASGCSGGAATAPVAVQAGPLQPQSVGRAQTGEHHDAQCDEHGSQNGDERRSKERDDRNEGCGNRCDDGDGRHAREHDEGDCAPPSPPPTPPPTPAPPGPLTLACDTSAVLGTFANCALANPSFAGSVALSYGGLSMCTGPAAVVVPLGAPVHFQVHGVIGGGCHVIAQVGPQQAAADISFHR